MKSTMLKKHIINQVKLLSNHQEVVEEESVAIKLDIMVETNRNMMMNTIISLEEKVEAVVTLMS